MKKIFATILVLASVSAAMNAQIVKQNIMDGYSASDTIEKAVYTAKDAPVNLFSWSAGYTSKPIEGAVSPVAGDVLSLVGYNEGGASIVLGSSFPEGVKGRRATVYSLTSGKEIRGGALYLAFLVKFDKIGTKTMSPLAGFCSGYAGNGNRGTVYVRRDAEVKKNYYFGVRLIEETVEFSQAFEMGQTNLVVLKIDYNTSLASLFINPDLSAGEPEPAAVANAGDSSLKHSIRALMVRDYYGYKGLIGNFRIARNWESLAE